MGLGFAFVVLGELDRLHRRTQGYTKSVAMLGCSLALMLMDWSSQSYDKFMLRMRPGSCPRSHIMAISGGAGSLAGNANAD